MLQRSFAALGAEAFERAAGIACRQKLDLDELFIHSRGREAKALHDLPRCQLRSRRCISDHWSSVGPSRLVEKVQVHASQVEL